MTDYRILTSAAAHSGWWLVVRFPDNKIVHSNPSVYRCLRWVKTWGQTEYALARPGSAR